MAGMHQAQHVTCGHLLVGPDNAGMHKAQSVSPLITLQEALAMQACFKDSNCHHRTARSGWRKPSTALSAAVHDAHDLPSLAHEVAPHVQVHNGPSIVLENMSTLMNLQTKK